MAIKPVGQFGKQTSITSSTAAADRTIMLRPQKGATFVLDMTDNTGLSTGAKIEVTHSPWADITAGTAVWVTPSGSSNGTTDVILSTTNPCGCQLTGVRAAVTDGTWSLSARQD